MAKIQKNFRFDENTIDELVKLSDKWELSQTEAIQRAIHEAIQNPEPVYTDSYTPETDEKAPDPKGFVPLEVFEALNNQLAVKDEQIANLNKALQNEQTHTDELTKSLQAAQALNAMDKPQAQEQPKLEQPKPTLRQRFKNWRNRKQGGNA